MPSSTQPENKAMLDHLKVQFREGLPVLFTGAGFSLGASDTKGRRLPSGKGLSQELWPIAFPNDPYEVEDVMRGWAEKNQNKTLTRFFHFKTLSSRKGPLTFVGEPFLNFRG